MGVLSWELIGFVLGVDREQDGCDVGSESRYEVYVGLQFGYMQHSINLHAEPKLPSNLLHTAHSRFRLACVVVMSG